MICFCPWCFHSLTWLSFHPAARTLEGQTQVLQLWSGWGFMWQFSQGWVAEKKKKSTLTFLSSPYHLSPYTWTSALVSLCWTLVSHPQPSLSSPLPELTAMCFTPRSWLGLCCDWASLRITDQKCPLLCSHLMPPPTHQALAPTPAIHELATPLGTWTCIFQAPNMPLFF